MYNTVKTLLHMILGGEALARLHLPLRHLIKVLYLGRAHECPCCGSHLRSFVERGELCPVCGAGRRHRLLCLYLNRECHIQSRKLSVLHIAPLRFLQHRFQPLPNLSYVSLDREMPHVLLRGDLTRLPIVTGRFALIICSHVLEHIPDDLDAMAELYRALAPGGAAIVQVPVKGDVTDEDPSVVDPSAREARFGQADHVRFYGLDIVHRLEQAGFTVDVNYYARIFLPEEQVLYGLDINEALFICKKP